VWLKAPKKKAGEKVVVRAKVTQLTVTVVELPAHVVAAYTVDGKPVAAAKLAELLAKERTVLIALDGKKVDPFYLQLYKEGTLVLVPPGDLGGVDHGGYPFPGPDVKPDGYPPQKTSPAEPPGEKD